MVNRLEGLHERCAEHDKSEPSHVNHTSAIHAAVAAAFSSALQGAPRILPHSATVSLISLSDRRSFFEASVDSCLSTTTEQPMPWIWSASSTTVRKRRPSLAC